MITIEHFENGKKEFATELEFVLFVQNLFIENELEDEFDSPIKDMEINSMQAAENYIKIYCNNYKVQHS